MIKRRQLLHELVPIRDEPLDPVPRPVHVQHLDED
ncbi:MAG: hypothetical protein K0S82_173, partial [Gaiellaceae bacterium]|nr:hypothetical protein [Gaiellaceae bacterium]